MKKLELINTNFSSGQMSAQMLTREDVASYANAAETLENVIPHLQGGVSRRPGTKFLVDLGAETRIIGFHFKDDQEYLFCLQASKIEVRNPTTGALITTISSCPWTVDQLWDIRFAQSGDTTIFVHPEWIMQKIKRTGATTFTREDFAFEEDSATTDKLFQPYFKFADDTVTLNPSGTTGSITLTTSADHWTSAYVGVNVRYKEKQLKITGFTDAQNVTATVLETLPSSSADIDWDEAVFSSIQKYARSVMFHGRRLWFGGTKALPQHLMGSKTNAPFNFDTGTAADDEAIFGQLGTDEVNEIRHMVSGRHLLMLTDDGEFFQSETADVKITPGKFNPRWQTGYGCSRVRPLLLDGAAIFNQDSGKTMREMVFDDIQQSHKADSINDMADDIITQFDDSALFVGDPNRIEQFGLFVDQSSGNIAVYHTSRRQNVFGWLKWTTEGDFRSVAEVDDRVFFVVKRAIPQQATCTITVANSGAIQAGDTITFQDNAGNNFTLTATTDDPPTGETATQLKFSMGGGRTNNDVADNIAVGHGGTKGINALSAFTAPNPAANVITVTRVAPGNNNLTVTSSRPSAIAVTNFTGGSTDKYYLEELSNAYSTDCSSDITRSDTTWGSATHIPGKSIRAVNSALTMEYGTFTLDVSGQFTFDHDDVSALQAGLWFAPKVTPGRAVGTAERGSISLKRKRLVRTILDLKDTYAITIDGKDLQLREVNDDPSLAPDALNGTFDVYHLGWDRFCQREITQSSALPMTIRALSREVAY